MTAHDLDGAAALLARRHERHRAHAPLLGPVDARRVVGTSLDEASGGLVGVDRVGTVQGYLLWRVRQDPTWGRFVWIDRADHASSDPELTRDLYAAAAEPWADEGIVKHAAVVPVLDGELDPWERLAFARMQVHALRSLPDGAASDPRVRVASADELDTVVGPFATLIWEHQATSPVLTGLTPPTWQGVREDWRETLDEPGVILLVAEVDGLPVGHALFHPADEALGLPPDTVRLAVAALHPAHRGRGLGRALTEAGFAAARRAGFRHVETDWRITNLPASRTWTALGFEPVFHRLWRVIGTG
jgi:GNAT superfamily N-acetyltransferase